MRFPALDIGIARSGDDVSEALEDLPVPGRLEVEVLLRAAGGHRDGDFVLEQVQHEPLNSGQQFGLH